MEQDLILSRAIIEMFNRPEVATRAAFRGGTALHKLFAEPPGRYSEDIDLVQREAGPIGSLVGGMRDALDPWLGEPKWKQGRDRFTLLYRFESTFEPIVQMRLKIEINTREHFNVLGLAEHRFEVENPWFSGSTGVTTYLLPELLGTKLRALYQRKKGRDLFDLWLCLTHQKVDPTQIIECFEAYLTNEGSSITRGQYEANMAQKMNDQAFLGDLTPLLRPGLDYSVEKAFRLVQKELIAKLRGDPWRSGRLISS